MNCCAGNIFDLGAACSADLFSANGASGSADLLPGFKIFSLCLHACLQTGDNVLSNSYLIQGSQDILFKVHKG